MIASPSTDRKLIGLLSHWLPPATVKKLRSVRDNVLAWWNATDLIRLGEIFGTDKWGSHWYLQHYETHFQTFRTRRLNLLEIGVGGYAEPGAGGNSLRMWKAYFPKSQIFGVDIHDKRSLEENRIRIFQGSQIDETFLRRVVDQIGGLDIVIDDGSHVNAHVIRTFEILFPLLKNPGIYAIEDTQTSYWPGFSGSSRDLNDPSTIMGYFARLVHSLNYEEILRENYSPNDFDRYIVAIHFYHNLILIFKGNNTEGSNILCGDATGFRTVFEEIAGKTADDGAREPCQR